MGATEHRQLRRTLGTVIRDRRCELGLSQEELAARVSDESDEVRQSDLSRIERGKVGLPRRARLERIARVLGLSLGELLALSGWAGAETAFAPEDAPPAVRPPIQRRTVAAAATVERGGGSRLRAAIAVAQELEARSERLLAEAVSTLERAGAVRRSPATDPPPDRGYDPETSPTA